MVAFDPLAVPRRTNSRVRLGVPARLELVSGMFDCTIEDLSVGGACLRLDQRQPKLGAPGVCRFEGHEAFGEVVWAAGQRCGFRFDDPLPESVVIAMRHAAAEILEREQTSTVRFARAWVRGDA